MIPRAIRSAAAASFLLLAGVAGHAGPVVAQRFMVVAAHPLAARAGYDAIRRGGSAIDAAIAVELVLGLVEPQSSGLGGGAFLLHYSARDAKVEAYDGRETAPAAAKRGRFLAADGRPLDWPDAVVSGKSVGAPACCGSSSSRTAGTASFPGRAPSSRRS